MHVFNFIKIIKQTGQTLCSDAWDLGLYFLPMFHKKVYGLQNVSRFDSLKWSEYFHYKFFDMNGFV